jgi:hypothetical protein
MNLITTNYPQLDETDLQAAANLLLLYAEGLEAGKPELGKFFQELAGLCENEITTRKLFGASSNELVQPLHSVKALSPASLKVLSNMFADWSKRWPRPGVAGFYAEISQTLNEEMKRR